MFGLLIIFILCFLQREQLYTYLAAPLLKQLPAGNTLIATQVTAPFLAPMKLSFILAIFLNIPICCYHLWSFIAPGLYIQEKKSILPLVILSCILFYLGMLFAFVIICPLALKFFANCAPHGVSIMTDIANYLDFMLAMLFAAGVAFQIPIVTIMLIKFGIVTKYQLAKMRPFMIVLAFILGMLLTPPDVVSQILLALPMWGLFELGLLLVQAPKA